MLQGLLEPSGQREDKRQPGARVAFQIEQRIVGPLLRSSAASDVQAVFKLGETPAETTQVAEALTQCEGCMPLGQRISQLAHKIECPLADGDGSSNVTLLPVRSTELGERETKPLPVPEGLGELGGFLHPLERLRIPAQDV